MKLPRFLLILFFKASMSLLSTLRCDLAARMASSFN